MPKKKKHPPRLPDGMASNDVIALLKRAGAEYVRTKGSHAHFRRGNRLITVPVGKQDLCFETLKSILIQQAGLSLKQIAQLRDGRRLDPAGRVKKLPSVGAKPSALDQ